MSTTPISPSSPQNNDGEQGSPAGQGSNPVLVTGERIQEAAQGAFPAAQPPNDRYPAINSLFRDQQEGLQQEGQQWHWPPGAPPPLPIPIDQAGGQPSSLVVGPSYSTAPHNTNFPGSSFSFPENRSTPLPRLLPWWWPSTSRDWTSLLPKNRQSILKKILELKLKESDQRTFTSLEIEGYIKENGLDVKKSTINRDIENLRKEDPTYASLFREPNQLFTPDDILKIIIIHRDDFQPWGKVQEVFSEEKIKEIEQEIQQKIKTLKKPPQDENQQKQMLIQSVWENRANGSGHLVHNMNRKKKNVLAYFKQKSASEFKEYLYKKSSSKKAKKNPTPESSSPHPSSDSAPVCLSSTDASPNYSMNDDLTKKMMMEASAILASMKQKRKKPSTPASSEGSDSE